MERLGIKQYSVLLILFAVLTAHFYLLLYYLDRHNPFAELHGDEDVIYAVISLVQQAKQTYSPQELNNYYQKVLDKEININDYSLQTSFTLMPKNKLIFQGGDVLGQLKNYLAHNHDRLNYSVQTQDGYWLNFNSSLSYHFYFIALILLLIEIVLFGSGLFYLFIMRYYAIPLTSFKKTAENLSADFHANLTKDNINTPLARETVYAINKLQERIQYIIDNRTRMIAAIAHDLRTPITRLKLLAHFIDNSQQAETMIRSLEEMENMITSVLNFSRIDAIHEPKVKLDIDALLFCICEDFTDQGFELSYSKRVRAILIYGRFLALKRAFINIVENGLKYGKKVDINLSFFTDDQVLICFDDDGPGISENELTKVFNPYYRSPGVSSSNNPGAGLGLTIVQEVINAHDGIMTIENRSDGGLSVKVLLPIGLPL